jgi:hypothetical protein
MKTTILRLANLLQIHREPADIVRSASARLSTMHQHHVYMCMALEDEIADLQERLRQHRECRDVTASALRDIELQDAIQRAAVELLTA